MPLEARPRVRAVHATAVSIAGRALVILGASKAGKSSLAAALCDATTRACPIALIGDDRLLVSEARDGSTDVRPHPRIAGFLERRGLGIVAVPFVARARTGALVHLGARTPADAALARLPALALADEGTERRATRVLAWWHTIADAAEGQQGAAKGA